MEIVSRFTLEAARAGVKSSLSIPFSIDTPQYEPE